jgi:hypothetical protein
MVAGQKVEDVVNGFTRTWYENFRLVCDRTADVFADAGD